LVKNFQIFEIAKKGNLVLKKNGILEQKKFYYKNNNKQIIRAGFLVLPPPAHLEQKKIKNFFSGQILLRMHEREEHIVHRYLTHAITGKGTPSGLPHEPNVRTRKVRYNSNGFGQISTHWSITNGAYPGITADVPLTKRKHDLTAVMFSDAGINGQAICRVYRPTNLLEWMCDAPRQNRMQHLDGNTGTDGDVWFVIPGLNIHTRFYNLRGFGAAQAKYWAWSDDSNQAMMWDAQEIPVTACATVCPASANDNTREESWTTIQTVFFWEQVASFTVSSPVDGAPDYDPTQFSAPVKDEMGNYLPLLYRDIVTGAPTSSKVTTVTSAMVGAFIPVSWTSAFPNWFGTRTRFSSMDVGWNPITLWGSLNAAGHTGPSSAYNVTVNKLYDGAQGLGYANVTATTYSDLKQRVCTVFGSRVPAPAFRFCTGIMKLKCMSQDTNFGLVRIAQHKDNSDISYTSFREINNGNYKEYSFNESELTAHYFPATPSDYEFFPLTDRGSGKTNHTVFWIVGATGGTSAGPSIAVTPVPVNFKVEIEGTLELYDERDGDNRDRHCNILKDSLSLVRQHLCPTEGSTYNARSTERHKEKIGAASLNTATATQAGAPDPAFVAPAGAGNIEREALIPDTDPTPMEVEPQNAPFFETALRSATGVVDDLAEKAGEVVHTFEQAAETGQAAVNTAAAAGTAVYNTGVKVKSQVQRAKDWYKKRVAQAAKWRKAFSSINSSKKDPASPSGRPPASVPDIDKPTWNQTPSVPRQRVENSRPKGVGGDYKRKMSTPVTTYYKKQKTATGQASALGKRVSYGTSSEPKKKKSKVLFL